MTFVIACTLYEMHMTHLTQLTKQVIWNVYDRIHFIFLLVVRVKHFSNNNNMKKLTNALRVFV